MHAPYRTGQYVQDRTRAGHVSTEQVGQDSAFSYQVLEVDVGAICSRLEKCISNNVVSHLFRQKMLLHSCPIVTHVLDKSS